MNKPRRTNYNKWDMFSKHMHQHLTQLCSSQYRNKNKLGCIVYDPGFATPRPTPSVAPSPPKPCKIVWFDVFRRDGLVVKSHLIYLGLCLTRCTDILLNLTRLRSSMSRYVRICSYSYLTWSNYYITWCCLIYPISPCCSWSCFFNFCLSKFVLLSTHGVHSHPE